MSLLFFCDEATMSVPTTKQPSVLLLCKSEQAAAVDKRALRDAGATRIRTMTSGLDAARIMAGLEPDKPPLDPDIIVCQHKLDDIDGEQFCALLRLHPRLLGTPILLLLPNDDEEAQLRALGCGASALMGRPFSVDALRKNLEALMAYDRRMAQLDRGKENADQQAFDDEVEAISHARRKNHIFFVCKAEQAAEHASCFIYHFTEIVGGLVTAAADIAADLRDEMCHSFGHTGRLWKRGAAVVQINLSHLFLPSLLIILPGHINVK